MCDDKKEYKDILFGYLFIPSYGCLEEDDGGFSITVYTDGRLVYKTYIFDRIEKTKNEYKISLNSIMAIKTIIEEYQEDINSFEKSIDNGSCDGYGNFFIFAGKEFITWNIEYNDENELKENYLEYYKEYLPVVRQQNKILLIFFKITKILKKEGINLKINMVSFRKLFIKNLF